MTPGIAASRSSMSRCTRKTRSGSPICVSDRVTRTNCTCSGSVKPGGTALSARNVRTISPDPTSSTSASATWTTTSTCRARWRSRLSLEPRPPARSVRARRRPPNLATGMLPKRSADDSESPSVKTSTAGSSVISCRRGMLAGPMRRQHAETGRREQESQGAAQQAEDEALRPAVAARAVHGRRRGPPGWRAPDAGPARARARGSRRSRRRSPARSRSCPSAPTACCRRCRPAPA